MHIYLPHSTCFEVVKVEVSLETYFIMWIEMYIYMCIQANP